MSTTIDPLEKFRQKPAAPRVVSSNPPPLPQPAKAPDEYAAFLARDRVERLRIKLVGRDSGTLAPAYRYLLDIVSDGEAGKRFTLLFTFMMVEVEGRNLQSVVMAIESDTAYFIQQFDTKRWKKPDDPGEPFIESIEVVKSASEVE